MEFSAMTLQEKIDTRENLITQARALNDGLKGEDGEIRSFTAEERSRYDGMRKDIQTLADLISQEKRSNELDGFTASAPVADGKKPEGDRMEAFREYLKTGRETRDLVVDGTGSSAGALAPQEFVKQIIADLQEDTPLLNEVNMIHLSQVASIGVPKEIADASDAAWTTEVPASVTADSTWAFGKRELGAIQLIKLVKVTKKLIKTSAFNIDQLVSGKLSLKIRQTLEKAIISGSGSGEPLGVFTASADGIPATQDVTAGSATAIDADDLIKTQRKIKAPYRARAKWVLNPNIVTDVLLLKDKNGQYIWRSGLTASDPDTLLGSPIVETTFAPETKATGLYVGAYGDFSNYWMTMVDQIGIQVLVEQYALSGEIGYLGTVFADGAPVLGEAFSRLKLA